MDEVIDAVRKLKKGKSPAADNIPAELVTNAEMHELSKITVEDLHRSMEQRKMAKKLDRILNYYNTKKGKSEKMQ